MKVWAIGEADHHAGYQLGLANPDAMITIDGEEQRAPCNEMQRALWEIRRENLDRARRMIGDDPCVYLFGGDICQGIKYVEQVNIPTLAGQLDMAFWNIAPIYQQFPTLRSSLLMWGTGVHSFGVGSAEVLIAKRLKERFPKVETMAVPHGRLDIVGTSYTIDGAHHGPGESKRKYHEGSNPLWYLRDAMYKDLSLGMDPATIYLRAHRHVFVFQTLRLRWGGKFHESSICVLPPQCSMSAHALKTTQSEPMQSTGFILLEFTEGGVVLHDQFVNYIDKRKRVTL